MAGENERLRATMREHGLTRREVARLCGVGVSTVDAWLAPAGSRWHRPVKARYCTLLALQLEHAALIRERQIGGQG